MKNKLINKVKDKKFNTEYLVTILLMLLLLWGIIYGVLFISRNISENGVYSFILFKTYKGDFLSFYISFILTVLIFLLSGFFLSLSPLGFAAIPFVSFVLGAVLSVSVYNAYLSINYKVMLYYLPFWAVFTSFLVMNYSYCFKSSFQLYRRFLKEKTELKEVSGTVIYKQSVKNFYASIIILAVFTALFGITEMLSGN